MKVTVLEHKQYGGYRAVCYHNVVDIVEKGSKTILYFLDGSKIIKLTRLIKSVEDEVAK